MTDKEKEKYHEINSEVSNSDISADDLFFEMLEEKLKKIEDFDEKEGVYMQILGLLESKFLDLKRESEDTTEVKNEIISKSIALFNQYIEEKKFDDANNLLNKLKKYDYDIINEEYELYTDENFSINISLSKLDLSKKYLELLEKHKNNSENFSKLKSQLEKVYSDETDVVHNELKTVKKKMENYEEKVEELVQIFTTYIKDKEVLHKVDEVSGQLKNSHRKLDNISHNIKNNNDVLIKSLLDGVIKTNRDLVVRVQKIYKNSKRDGEVAEILDTTTVDMSQGIDNVLSNDDVVKVIKRCNFTLYKGIKRLYKRDNDSIKNDLFREALAVAEKRHQQHLVSLKRSLKEKREEVELLNKEISNLKESIVSLKNKNMSLDEKMKELTQIESNCKNLKNKIKIDKDNLSLEAQKKLESTTTELEKEISELKSQLTLKEKNIELIKSQFREEIAILNSWIPSLESEYKESKQQSQKISEKFSELSDEKAKLERELEKFSNFDETKKNDIKLVGWLLSSSYAIILYESIKKYI